MKTLKNIRDLNPCYDPIRYLPEDWIGDAVEILEHPDIPPIDKLWVVEHWLDDRTLRLFAVWCAREVLSLLEDPDPRSVEAANVAEAYANGEATKEQLDAAHDAADAVAARAAARHATFAAAVAVAAAAVAAADAADAAARSAARKDFWYQAIGKLHEMVTS